jgi:hypothetical protein
MTGHSRQTVQVGALPYRLGIRFDSDLRVPACQTGVDEATRAPHLPINNGQEKVFEKEAEGAPLNQSIL